MVGIEKTGKGKAQGGSCLTSMENMQLVLYEGRYKCNLDLYLNQNYLFTIVSLFQKEFGMYNEVSQLV